MISSFSTFQVALIAIGVACTLTGLISAAVGVYVTLANRALLAEVRREMAELENRIVVRINGTYVRTAEWKLRSDALDARFDSLLDGMRSPDEKLRS